MEESEAPGMTPLTERLRSTLDQIPAAVVVFYGDDLVVGFTNQVVLGLAGTADVVGRPLRELLPPAATDSLTERYVGELRRVLATAEAAQGWAAPARLPGAADVSYWDYVMVPVADPGQPPSGVAVHAVDVTRLVEARHRAEEAEHRFTALFESNALGVTITGDELVQEANDAFLELVGRTREELAAGLSWRDMTAPECVDADQAAIRALLATGGVSPYEKTYLRPDGTRVPALVSGSLLRADPLQVVSTVHDLRRRKRVDAEVAAASARTARLQELTAALSATNSADEIARAVVHQALEDVSASAAVLVRGRNDPQVAHAVGFPPGEVDEWRQFPALLPPPLLEALRTGQVVVAGGAEVLAHAHGVEGAATVAAFPLEVTGRLLGGLGLAFRDARELDAPDRDFLLSVARQAATALDRAQLYENRAYVARKLQEGLLPQRLAEIPGLESAVVYESISGRGEVGGDFYDLFEGGGGRHVLAVGDVAGKGTDAAVVTGLARHTIRAAARLLDSPSAILGFLNDALLRHAGPPAFCTVACAVIGPRPQGGFRVRVASGGHPYPLALRAGRTIESIEVHGMLLGFAEDPELADVELALEPGDALVLYTDGVTDARRAGGERFGEQRLLDALHDAAGGTAAALAGAVEQAVREHLAGAEVSADDRAIAVVRALG